ncbi:hypothetical protein DPEC_G00338710 [Dallia pectoralis]|uniref:Uncharacterized protein n=1 Tax=Dallia pectoralis TaxID=75939 RepID=A0ACC2F4M9_DALPE|nr:hypothetical protein DPEC_G00338710 [Dallia pectoralis]
MYSNLKDQLYTDNQALLVVDLMVGEILAHLRPTVSFRKGTKEGDNRPYSINIPVRRETVSPDDAPDDADKTMLELRIDMAIADRKQEPLDPPVSSTVCYIPSSIDNTS